MFPKTLFDLGYLAASPFVVAAMMYKSKKYGKYKRSGPGMLTLRLPEKPVGNPDDFRCWMHAVSVGESVAAGAFFRHLKAIHPEWSYLATTTTETGQDQAQKSIKGADDFAFSPFDYTPFLERFHAIYRPSVYCFFETEIWPNHLRLLGKRNIPTFLINGKLSSNSATNYRRTRHFLNPSLNSVTHFFMQTEKDAHRLYRIIKDHSRITVTGNIKFDALPEPLTTDQRLECRHQWNIKEDELLLIAGSTHPTEESMILEAFASAKQQNPKLRLAIAPRHPERFEEVAQLIQETGTPLHQTSDATKQAEPDSIILINQMGVLSSLFGAGDLALLGGAWNPIGGHNLLEPAIHGIPVLRGPHMHAQEEIVRVLSPTEGGLEVPAENLSQTILQLAENNELRQELGQKAQTAALSSRGAAEQVVQKMLTMI